MFYTFLSTNPSIIPIKGIFGFAISANYSLTSPMLVNMVSIDEFSNAYGLLLLIQGVSNLVGPPFAGYLYDISHVWYYTFGFGGIFITLSGIFVVLLPFVSWLRSHLTQSKEKNGPSQAQKEDVEIDSFVEGRGMDITKTQNKYGKENGISDKGDSELRLVDTEVVCEGSINQNKERKNTIKSFNHSNNGASHQSSPVPV